MKPIQTNNVLIRVTTVPISLEKLISGQMRFMNEQGFEVYMVSSAYDKANQLEAKESSSYLTVNMTRTISPFKDLVSLYQLVKVFKKVKPLIVHTHTPKAGLLGMIASWIARVPVRLHTVAGLPLMESTGFKRKILEFVERVTYYCAVKIYPNSKNLKEFIIENKFCKANKLKVIGNGSSNGINTAYFKNDLLIEEEANVLKKRFSIVEDNFVFIFIGRLVRDKGIEELVEAFVVLNDSYPATRLILVGPFESELDPLSNSCLRKINDNEAIIKTGFQNDVRPYLAISNALVFPSYREGFPNVPMQAGCFNLPCIVTNINGCNEIIEDEINGLIIPPKNTTALQNAMERLIVDSVLYDKVKSNARKMIIERYEQNYFWGLLLNEYKQQLSNNGIAL